MSSGLGNPVIVWASEVRLRYHGTEEMDPLCGDPAAYLPTVLDDMKMAIENVGSENLEGSAVQEALYSFKNYALYRHGTTLDYTDPQIHGGSPSTRIYQIQGSVLVPASDPREAPLLWPVK